MKNMQYKQGALNVVDIVLDGYRIWFICDGFNALFSYDCIKREIELVSEIPMLPLMSGRAFENLFKIGNNLIFVPCCADAIYTYDIINKRFHRIELPLKWFNKKSNGVIIRFCLAVDFNDCLYMIGEKCIVEFNVKSNKIIFFDKWYDEYCKIFIHNQPLCDKDYVKINEKIFLPPSNGDCIIEIDMNNQNVIFNKIELLEYKNCNYYTMSVDKYGFWIFNSNKKTVINLDFNYTLKKTYFINDLPDLTNNFRYSYKKDEKIYFFYTDYYLVLIIDLNNRSSVVRDPIYIEQKNLFLGKVSYAFDNIKQSKDKLYLIERSKNIIYIRDKNLAKIANIDLKINNRVLIAHTVNIVKFNCILKEGAFYYNNLERLLFELETSDTLKKEIEQMKIGKKILEIVKG